MRREPQAVACLRMVRMQRVHALIRRATPFTSTEVFWTLGSQRRLVFRFEWLTLCPKVTLLPHSSQRLDTIGGRLA
jgi:hypothetical protein